MEKRTLKQWCKENKREALICISIIIGILVFGIISFPIEKVFLKMHESDFELCEQEARSKYSQIIQIIQIMNEAKQSEDFLISYDGYDEMPIIIVKTPNYQGKVTARYRNGKVVTSRVISRLELLFGTFMATIGEIIYILIVRYIYKRKKRKTDSLE